MSVQSIDVLGWWLIIGVGHASKADTKSVLVTLLYADARVQSNGGTAACLRPVMNIPMIAWAARHHEISVSTPTCLVLAIFCNGLAGLTTDVPNS